MPISIAIYLAGIILSLNNAARNMISAITSIPISANPTDLAISCFFLRRSRFVRESELENIISILDFLLSCDAAFFLLLESAIM